MFNYFGYGSNINLTALKAKGVEPLSSEVGKLKGWRLKFNVQHWFKHEGGMGNIEKTNSINDYVEGILHVCEDDSLIQLDKLEALGIGYDRIEIDVETKNGRVKALTYVGLPNFINNNCLPTQRYKNIIVSGAEKAGLTSSYINKIKKVKTHKIADYPKFVYPLQNNNTFNKKTLSDKTYLTALNGFVFDMRNSRKELECLLDIFGGKDMTLFHLKRLDSSKGNESLEDIINGNISEEGLNYINIYLHEYSKEFKCVGRYTYTQ
ncbi:gamma-glutamylcyclotransferase family protein [Winogradskyella sp. A3E31]|uniref:gamma-glutamylcyclotransferase family protein n=1 Tax=Winogradskyella sp. A3E31 TaxID=3349637 RepID=UPI00398B30F8